MFWFPGIHFLHFLFPHLWTSEEQVYSEVNVFDLGKTLFFWESVSEFHFPFLSDGVEVNKTWKSESKFKEEKEIMVPSEQDHGSAFRRNGSDARAIFTQHFYPLYLSQTAWADLSLWFQNTQFWWAWFLSCIKHFKFCWSRYCFIFSLDFIHSKWLIPGEKHFFS